LEQIEKGRMGETVKGVQRLAVACSSKLLHSVATEIRGKEARSKKQDTRGKK